jgi:hypothetical protein
MFISKHPQPSIQIGMTKYWLPVTAFRNLDSIHDQAYLSLIPWLLI